MNHPGIVLIERSLSQEVMCYKIPFIWLSQRQIVKKRRKISGFQGLGVSDYRGMIGESLFWRVDDGIVLYPGHGGSCMNLYMC